VDAEPGEERWPVRRVAALLVAFQLCSSPLAADSPLQVSLGASTDPSPAEPIDTDQGWAFGLIAAYDQFRDDALIPLRWSGPGIGLSVGWGRAKGPVRHGFALAIPVSLLDNRFDDPGYALGIEVSYTFGHLIAADVAQGSAYLGLRAEWDLHNGFYESWDDEHIYWLNVYSVGPRGAWSRPLGERTRVSATLDVPLLALVGRPPANRLNKTDRLTSPLFHVTEPHDDMTVATVWDYQAVHMRLSIARRWGGSWLVISYGLERSSYETPARIDTFTNRLSIERHAIW
jgi:hypothetical protein